MVQNKVVVFKAVPEGMPVNGTDLVLEERDFDASQSPPPGGLILQNHYASLDPYLRGRLRPAHVPSYMPAFELGKPIVTRVLSSVLASDHSDFSKGDRVIALTNLEEYSVITRDMVKTAALKKIDNKYDLDELLFLGPLGMPGATAYSGLFEIGKPKKGETIFVSAASGAVGQVVGAIARHEGLKVIGSAGSDAKVDFVVNELKFDSCFNYKKEKSSDALKRLAPQGIDIYWDNVGGETLEAALDAMNDYGRVVICGAISQYNLPREKQHPIRNLTNMLIKRLTMQGFLIAQFAAKYASEHPDRVGEWLKKEEMVVKMDVTPGIDKAIDAFIGLLKGENFGKVVVQLSA